MSSFETFEWFVSSTFGNPPQEILRIVREHRECLLALRSEDERQRFVDDVIKEMQERYRHGDTPRNTIGGYL